LPIFGATLAFLAYNMYPSRIFLGNVGSFLIGSAIGGYFVLANMEMFGVIILIPHIINLLMWIYWGIRKYPYAKFGKLRQDGTIEAPNSLTIKYLVTRIFKVTEPEAVWVCYAITAVFGVIGLVVV
jgi:UDP-N-acetylglucosamine--dolichyl-phosphate N-acetylglucosaminephosphotransferase